MAEDGTTGTQETAAPTHRTTVDIEVDAYERARSILGTQGYKDTVNAALRIVDHTAQLRRGAELIRAGGLALGTPEELAEMRQARA